MGDFGRRDWEDGHIQALLDMWPRVMSIVLIALELKRSTSSVQTMASRKNLPRRTEGNERHRRKWSPEDVDNLKDSLRSNTDADGKILICEIADEMGRSIDAVAAKLTELEEFGSEKALFERIRVTRKSFGVSEPEKQALPKGGDTRKVGKKRPCMCCQEIFWSEGAHNRLCAKCKKDEGGSDWDW
jgi:hypothetical protein